MDEEVGQNDERNRQKLENAKECHKTPTEDTKIFSNRKRLMKLERTLIKSPAVKFPAKIKQFFQFTMDFQKKYVQPLPLVKTVVLNYQLIFNSSILLNIRKLLSALKYSNFYAVALFFFPDRR